MPYQTESEDQLLLSEELTLSLKRFELVGYYYYYLTLFLSIIVLFISRLTIRCSILYWHIYIVLHNAIIVYHTHFIQFFFFFFMVKLLCNYVNVN